MVAEKRGARNEKKEGEISRKGREGKEREERLEGEIRRKKRRRIIFRYCRREQGKQ